MLGISTHAADALVAAALDLRHRLPGLWTRVQAGEVKAWIGRKVADATRHLTIPTCGQVDTEITPYADRISWTRLDHIIEATWMRTDPEAAEQADQAARESLGAWVSGSTEQGTKTVFVRAEAPDVIRFDGTLDRVADSLSILGDPRSKDQRRAAALGWLANPQATLDLFDQTADSLGIAWKPHHAQPTAPAGRPAAAGHPLRPPHPPHPRRQGGRGGTGGRDRTGHPEPAPDLAVQQPGHREAGDRPAPPDPGRCLRDPEPGPAKPSTSSAPSTPSPTPPRPAAPATSTTPPPTADPDEGGPPGQTADREPRTTDPPTPPHQNLHPLDLNQVWPGVFAGDPRTATTTSSTTPAPAAPNPGPPPPESTGSIKLDGRTQRQREHVRLNKPPGLSTGSATEAGCGCSASGYSMRPSSKQVSVPVWQAGPVWSTTSSSVSPSQSTRSSRTCWR